MRQVPEILKFLIKDVVWRMNPDERCIYLTFDDGPIPEVTPLVLDILDDFHAKATFLCVGENVSKYPEVLENVKQQGHAVGNHTFNHVKGFQCSVDDYRSNVMKADELIKSPIFRPPHGQIKPQQIKDLKKNFKILLWDFITYDYDKSIAPTKVYKEVQNKSRNGSIVVFHDSLKAQKKMLEVLPKALKFWQTEGYEIKKVSL